MNLLLFFGSFFSVTSFSEFLPKNKYILEICDVCKADILKNRIFFIFFQVGHSLTLIRNSFNSFTFFATTDASQYVGNAKAKNYQKNFHFFPVTWRVLRFVETLILLFVRCKIGLLIPKFFQLNFKTRVLLRR